MSDSLTLTGVGGGGTGGVPANALLDDNGQPLLDDNGQYLLQD